MLRLLTEVEKNTSWIPYEKYFLTQNKVSELLSNTKSCEEPVSFTREILPVKEELPPVPVREETSPINALALPSGRTPNTVEEGVWGNDVPS